MEKDQIIQIFPFLKDFDDKLKKEMLLNSTIHRVPEGTSIFSEGESCQSLSLILSGVIKVFKLGENGREIILYRVMKGEICILTASSILSQNPFPANAVVEENVEVAVIPSELVRQWVNRHELWRNYIFGILNKRFSEVIFTLDEVVFRRMDSRIATMLVQLSQHQKELIKITHQNIATELGTSREVVSRILKYFESENWIILKRGEIVIKDLKCLKTKMI